MVSSRLKASQNAMAALRCWLAAIALVCMSAAHALDPRRAAEDYVVDHWGIGAGLPQVSVTSIAQDRTGYLWLSTQGGLARFDGLNFRVYGAADLVGYDPAIQDRVWADAAGRLWLATPRGAAWIEDDALQPVAGLTAKVGQVHTFADGPGGSVLIGTDHGLYAFADGPAQQLGLGDVRVYALLVDGDQIYAGSDERVFRIRAGIAERVEATESIQGIRFRQLIRVGNRSYVGSSRGLFELRGGLLERPQWAASLAPVSIEALGSDRDDNLWIGLLDGLWRYHPERGLERAFDRLDDVQAWIAAFHEDADGNLWVGSYTTGLSRWWNGWAQRIGSQHGLSDPFVWSVARGPDERVWFGTATGLWRLDTSGSPVLVSSTLELPNSAVYNLYFDRDGQAWLGTRSGMALWDGNVLRQPEVWSPLRQAQINAVLEQGTGRYWIGTSAGLHLQEQGLLKRYGSDEGLDVAPVRSLVALDEQLYVGTEQGLYVGVEGRFRRVGGNAVLDQALITTMKPVLGNKLLIGTFDDGLFLLDLAGIRAIGEPEGLPWPQVANLQVDRTHVWASGPRGVYRFGLNELEGLIGHGAPLRPQPILNEARDARGGQRLRCCNAGAISRGLILGGKLWFPSLNGLVRIDPASIKPPQSLPRIIIEEVLSDGGGQWQAQSPLHLAAADRDLTLRYTALSFRDPEGLRFRHRLVGYEEEWQPFRPQRYARYTNLAPGHYRFEVQAMAGDGRLAEDQAELALIIPPTLTETLWFRTLLVLLLALLLTLVGIWTRRQSRLREQLLQHQVARRTEELRRANERLRNANQALAAESLTDGLTGLKNRRFLARHLGEWRRQRLLGESEATDRLWFFLIDLDHFKRVNDQLGHLAGDEVLRQVAQLLIRLAGERGQALRWGGEEFLILLPEQELKSADGYAERIVKAVRRADFRVNETTPVHLTTSVGVAAFPALADGSDLVDWALAMEMADAGLYHSKLNGRDSWSRLQPSAEARYRDFAAGFGSQVDEVLNRGLATWHSSAAGNGPA